jgi:hypothetical protein
MPVWPLANDPICGMYYTGLTQASFQSTIAFRVDPRQRLVSCRCEIWNLPLILITRAELKSTSKCFLLPLLSSLKRGRGWWRRSSPSITTCARSRLTAVQFYETIPLGSCDPSSPCYSTPKGQKRLCSDTSLVRCLVLVGMEYLQQCQGVHFPLQHFWTLCDAFFRMNPVHDELRFTPLGSPNCSKSPLKRLVQFITPAYPCYLIPHP